MSKSSSLLMPGLSAVLEVNLDIVLCRSSTRIGELLPGFRPLIIPGEAGDRVGVLDPAEPVLESAM